MKTIESFPADWSELPGDLLGQIIEKFITITSLSDYIRLGAGCSSWRFFFTTENHEQLIKLSSRLPVLLIPSWPKINTIERFYSLSEKKAYNFQLPVSYNKKCWLCCGSSHGWLVTVVYDNVKDDLHDSIKLLNPFRSFNNEITLPPLYKVVYHQYHRRYVSLTKVFLSADPWPLSSSKPVEDVIVIGIYSPRWPQIAYCRLGDKVWTSMCTWGHKVRTSMYTWEPDIHDVIYYKSKFYATLGNGFMVAFDIGHDPPQESSVKRISPNTKNNLKPNEGEEMYLVECSEDLLQVFRVYEKPTDSTIRFEVYKIDWQLYSDDNHDWVRGVRVRDLNGFSLFLGVNASISVNAADSPGCKPDCIYFTSGLYQAYFGPWDMGVFCLLDESFEPHYPFNNTNKDMMPSPIWIQPTQISDLINLITGIISYEKIT